MGQIIWPKPELVADEWCGILGIAVTISLISLGQYYSAWSNYNEAIKCLAAIPKYRIQVGVVKCLAAIPKHRIQ